MSMAWPYKVSILCFCGRGGGAKAFFWEHGGHESEVHSPSFEGADRWLNGLNWGRFQFTMWCEAFWDVSSLLWFYVCLYVVPTREADLPQALTMGSALFIMIQGGSMRLHGVFKQFWRDMLFSDMLYCSLQKNAYTVRCSEKMWLC